LRLIEIMVVRQIEIFNHYDPLIQYIVQKSKIEYSLRYVDVTDNKTGETFRIYVNETEEKKLFKDPEKYMEKYFKKYPQLIIEK